MGSSRRLPDCESSNLGRLYLFNHDPMASFPYSILVNFLVFYCIIISVFSFNLSKMSKKLATLFSMGGGQAEIRWLVWPDTLSLSFNCKLSILINVIGLWISSSIFRLCNIKEKKFQFTIKIMELLYVPQ